LLYETLVAILKDQRPIPPDHEIPRELAPDLPLRPSHALALTGVRRSGKSVLQSQIMRRGGAALYCNLEDTRLYGLAPADIPAFLSALEGLGPRSLPVFLDEVQELPEWQRLVRTLLDRGRTVCITGSNASLLGRELGVKLTGRHLSFEVLPFSYSEFLAAAHARPGPASFSDYLDLGGFPGFLRDRDPLVLQQLLRDVVQRDIAIRHGLRETRHVMNLALFLLANTGQPFSIQSLSKSLAIPSVAQASRALEHLQDAYLLLALPRFSPSFKRRVVAPAKYYAVDTGLRRAASPQPGTDLGPRLENAVYLHLRRQGGPLHYAAEKDAWECDFVTDRDAIQVCADLHPGNLAREVRGLLRACALPPRRRRPLLVTLRQRDEIVEAGLRIPVLPAWQWMRETAP
jgi:hypothetical protein